MKPIFKALEYYGWEIRQGGESEQIRCPRPTNHGNDDETFSAKVYEDSGIIHCFGCGFRESIVGFIEFQEGISRKDAKELAFIRFGWEHEGDTNRDLLEVFNDFDVVLTGYLWSKKVRGWDVRELYQRLDVMRAILSDEELIDAERNLNKCVESIKLVIG